ncbi:MAG: FAD-dependent oxidoreductase [Pseudomonadota bacterium]
MTRTAASLGDRTEMSNAPTRSAAPTPTAIIVGGGVAGLTAAQELAERGFKVTVFERKDILGGKARSVEIPQTATPATLPLPGEHGFRFLPACYRHLPDTMRRIPRADGTCVADSLVSTTEVLFATYANPPFSLPLTPPKTKGGATGFRVLASHAWKLVTFLPGMLDLKEENTHLTAGDLAFYAGKLWQILTTCPPRRLRDFENLAWWTFLDADARSPAFRKYLAIGLTRNLVACKADKANTLTIGQIAVQLILSVFRPAQVDRVLDGPTNEVWINPWRDYLANPTKFARRPPAFRHPVDFRMGLELAAIDVDEDTQQVTGIRVRAADRKIDRVREAVRAATARAEADPAIRAIASGWERHSHILKEERAARLTAEEHEKAKGEQPTPIEHVRGDHYVFALPVEQIAAFMTPSIETIDPRLRGLRQLREQVDWMTGIQFYLTREVDLPVGHVDYLDTEWALTSIAQDDRLWPRGMARFGDGTVRQILSVDISDWSAKDPQGREAWDLPPLDVAREVWRQLQQSLNRHGAPLLLDDMLHPQYRWFLDDDIDERIDPRKLETKALANGKPDLLVNAEPLLVNLAGSRALRPDAVTGVKNMYLASDYVLTHTELATMEAANEAARRAVNGILGKASGEPGACVVEPFREPLQFLRSLDQAFLRRGWSWPYGAVNIALTVGVHVAVLGCRTLMLGKELLAKSGSTLADLPRGSPLRAP